MKFADKIRSLIRNKSLAVKYACWVYNHLPFGNKFKMQRGGVLCADYTFIKKSKFVISGINNKITVLPGTRLTNCYISICGCNNDITIGNDCSLNNLEICIEDDNNTVHINDNTSVAGNTHIACIEGSSVEIGRDCMFSANITIRTGDSHSVTTLDGRRINPSKDIKIGNHVWVGNTVIITKGVNLLDNSIVGTGSVVTKSFEQSNVVIAGNPAKVVKTNITWARERISI